jgi:hypothetical protein
MVVFVIRLVRCSAQFNRPTGSILLRVPEVLRSCQAADDAQCLRSRKRGVARGPADHLRGAVLLTGWQTARSVSSAPREVEVFTARVS